MNDDISKPIDFWKRQFGEALIAKDFAGRPILKSAYNQRSSVLGWNLDHIYPKSRGGKDSPDNIQCVNIQTNDDKDSKTIFWTNGSKYSVVKQGNAYAIRPDGPIRRGI